MTDSDPDVRWLSYAEAAKALDVNPESVARRMRRDGWARRRGNDGKPRVAVPVALLPVLAGVPVDGSDVPDNVSGLTPSVPDVIPDENPDAERAARAEGEAAALREERDRLLREREAIQAEATRERDRAEGALIRAAAAEAEAKALRETLEEARRPFWRRWIG